MLFPKRTVSTLLQVTLAPEFNPKLMAKKSGNIVTLWGASSYSGGTAVLTLQKSNNSWLIQSFQAK